MDEDIEICPGIFFRGEKGNFQLVIRTAGETFVAWDYEQICLDPIAWMESLKSVAAAMQFGPTVAKKRIEEKKPSLDVPIGPMYCNVCSRKFILGPQHEYFFKGILNGKNYLDFQCSDICNKKRRAAVYSEVLGEDFLTRWSNSVRKPHSNEAS